MSFFVDLVTNKIFIAGILTYFITQFLKLVVYSIKAGKFMPEALFAFGGMPSSHTSVSFALLTSIYLTEGVSTLFVLTIFITLVVIQDITIGRWHTQKHAQYINKLVHIFKIKYKPVEELSAHTPLEVIAGAVLGILMAVAVFLC